MKKTKIVCTIGPATKEVETLKQMILAGMNVARINFSHGGYPEQEGFVKAVKQAREELGMPVSLLLDTQGPEIRTGKLEEAPVQLVQGEKIVLVNEDIIGNKDRVSVSYKDLYKDVKPGSVVLIDDGKIELSVEKIEGKDIYCKIMNTGFMGNRKSINLPGTNVSLPALKEKDIQDLKDGCLHGFDYVAASFIRSANDVREIRKVLDENGGKGIKIISKIENKQGIDNLEEIIQISDGLMVARGDMGVEIPLEQVPLVQKRMIKECNRMGKIVITATQMLESMTENPKPTRAEVSDVANAIYDGTGAIMLSGESAMGKYPVKCVETMSKIANAVENDINYWKRFDKTEYNSANLNYEFNLNRSICLTAHDMNVKAIVSYTECGNTPRMISSFMPKCPIYAITSNEQTYRQLGLSWNTIPVLVKENVPAKELIFKGIEKLKVEGKLENGDVVVVAGGDSILANSSDSINRTIGGVLRV